MATYTNYKTRALLGGDAEQYTYPYGESAKIKMRWEGLQGYEWEYANLTFIRQARLSLRGGISNPQSGYSFWVWSVQDPGKVLDGLGGWSGTAAGWIPNGNMCLRLSF